jgi:hypothetical protein
MDFKFLKNGTILGIVAHICNPSYLGAGDLEDQGSRPAWARSS